MQLFEYLKEKKILSVITENTDYVLKSLKYLSPDGETECPDQVFYAKGQWYKKVKINENAFKCEGEKNFFGEAIAPEQYGLSKYRGGIIVFSTDVNAVNSQNKNIWQKVKSFFSNKINTFVNRLKKNKKLVNLVKKHNVEYENIEDYFIGAFTIGNFFKGRYVGNDGNIYDEKSTTIEIAGVPSEVLLLLGIEIANEFKQETVLIKDLNKNKFYLADRKKVKDAGKELKKL